VSNADGKGTFFGGNLSGTGANAHNPVTIQGRANDSAANVGVKIGNGVAMTSGRDRSLVGIYSDSGVTTTKIVDFFPDGGANFTGKLGFAAGGYTANGTVATAMSNLGPAGSHTTIQKWLTIYDTDGTTLLYIPCF
jgi:hypothetical protein